MKFSLYGRGGGVQAECLNPLFIVVDNQQLVVDLSASARQKGIVPGMVQKSAVSLCPEINILPVGKELTSSIELILRIFWSHTPWIQTERNESFYVQLSGDTPPIREVRDILLEINNKLSPEQHIRLGFAENPFLARLLLEWNGIERIPGALYRKVGRQFILISPNLAGQLAKNNDGIAKYDWWEDAPIQSLWVIPAKKRSVLYKLGVHSLKELNQIPNQLLLSQFGRESLLWKQILRQVPGGSVFVNYPTYEKRSVWISDVHERPPVYFAKQIVSKLVQDLSNQLSQIHSGAMKVGIRWRTDLKEEDDWKTCMQPVYRSSEIFSRIQPILDGLSGNVLESIVVWIADIQPLLPIQSSFVLRKNQFRLNTNLNANVMVIHSEINSRIPNQLQYGIQSSFREQRLHETSSVI